MESIRLQFDRMLRKLAKHAKNSGTWEKILFCLCACLCASTTMICFVFALDNDNKSTIPLTLAEAAQTAFATSTPVVVLLCANRHGSLALKEQLRVAVDTYNLLKRQESQTFDQMSTETAQASRLVVHSECASAQWDAIGKLLFEDALLPTSDRSKLPRYALLVTDHDQYPLSVRSPSTLIQNALADVLVQGQPDILGAAAAVEDSSVVLRGAFAFTWAEVTAESAARNDDIEWWDTGRPFRAKDMPATRPRSDEPSVPSVSRTRQSHFHHLQQQQQKEEDEEDHLHSDQNSYPQTKFAAALNQSTLRPCFMLPRKEWTMRILPSTTGSDCDAVGSSFLVNIDVIVNMAGPASLRKKVWPRSSAASLDTGLIDFFVTLKRARWRGLRTADAEDYNKHVHRTGIAAAKVPWFSVSAASSENRGHAFEGTRPSILDGIGVEWFPSSAMHRHTDTLPMIPASTMTHAVATNSNSVKDTVLLDGARPPREIPQRVPSTPRQRAMIAALSRRHDLREIEAPDGSVMHLGCAADEGRCPMHFVERGFAMPPCCRAKLRKLLLYISRALTERGVVHWIDFGTLIGAVRTSVAGLPVTGGELLSHDYDADIVVDARQWGVVRAMQAQVATVDGHVLFEEQEGFIRFFFSAHNGVYVDMYAAQAARPGEVPALQVVRDEMMRDAQSDAAATARFGGRGVSPPMRQMWYLTAGKQDWFDASYVFPMGACVMEGETLPCPTRPREFLEKWRANLYGGKKVWSEVSRKLYKGPDPAKLRGGPRPEDFMEGETRETFERWMRGLRSGA